MGLNPNYRMLDGDVRPHPIPVMDCERGPAKYVHPMMQKRAQASSLPNLRPTSGNGSAAPSGRSMQRDMSQGNVVGNRPSRLQSGAGTPSGYQAAEPGMDIGTLSAVYNDDVE